MSAVAQGLQGHGDKEAGWHEIESSGARFWGNEAGLFRSMVFATLQRLTGVTNPTLLRLGMSVTSRFR
jgi:hypothetical protein